MFICAINPKDHSLWPNKFNYSSTRLPKAMLICRSTHVCLAGTDRGDPSFGNTLNRASVEHTLSPEKEPQGPSKDMLVAEYFHEAMGLARDPKANVAYVADLLGSLWSINLETHERKALKTDVGNLSGLTLAH